MRFFENLKRSLGMAKKFKGGIKEVEEIAERVAEEEIEEMVEDGPMTKEEFLISKGLDARPNSHMAIKAWEEYNAS